MSKNSLYKPTFLYKFWNKKQKIKRKININKLKKNCKNKSKKIIYYNNKIIICQAN